MQKFPFLHFEDLGMVQLVGRGSDVPGFVLVAFRAEIEGVEVNPVMIALADGVGQFIGGIKQRGQGAQGVVPLGLIVAVVHHVAEMGDENNVLLLPVVQHPLDLAGKDRRQRFLLAVHLGIRNGDDGKSFLQGLLDGFGAVLAGRAITAGKSAGGAQGLHQRGQADHCGDEFARKHGILLSLQLLVWDSFPPALPRVAADLTNGNCGLS